MRLTFLSHFILCLACAAAAWFAYRAGVFATVWANDASMMTSAIGALFVGTACWLGWQAWLADGAGQVISPISGRAWDMQRQRWGAPADAAFGRLSEKLCVMMGLAGTTLGLALQGKALMGGSASFGALSTSLFTTCCGVIAAAIVAVMTHSLEAGIRRSRQ